MKIANNKKYPIKKKADLSRESQKCHKIKTTCTVLMELVENKKQSSNFRYCVRASNTFSRFRTFSVITSSINVSNLGWETIRPRNSGVV